MPQYASHTGKWFIQMPYQTYTCVYIYIYIYISYHDVNHVEANAGWNRSKDFCGEMSYLAYLKHTARTVFMSGWTYPRTSDRPWRNLTPKAELRDSQTLNPKPPKSFDPHEALRSTVAQAGADMLDGDRQWDLGRHRLLLRPSTWQQAHKQYDRASLFMQSYCNTRLRKWWRESW